LRNRSNHKLHLHNGNDEEDVYMEEFQLRELVIASKLLQYHGILTIAHFVHPNGLTEDDSDRIFSDLAK
jgi:hypothetical protein